MGFDSFLAERIERVLKEKRLPFEPRKMFGGICYLVDDKMCVGIFRNQLMVRIDPLSAERELKKPGLRPMDDSGKSMKGFIMVDPEYIDMDEDLDYWIVQALLFNPFARRSKK